MKCIVFSVQAEDGQVISGRIQSPKGKTVPVTEEDAKTIKEGMEEEGFKVLEFKLVEVQ